MSYDTMDKQKAMKKATGGQEERSAISSLPSIPPFQKCPGTVLWCSADENNYVLLADFSSRGVKAKMKGLDKKFQDQLEPKPAV